MKIVFIGCVQFSFLTLQNILHLENVQVIGVVTKKISKFNADFYCLEKLAISKNIPCFIAETDNQIELKKWLEELDPDVIYCFGWPHLLKKDILQIPKLGVIGYHPTKLPQNRGRHPIIWALALGLSKTASTFFFMDEGADSGDILSQKTVIIKESDDASILYNKLTDTALEQIQAFTKNLLLNNFVKIPQDSSRSNYWRKREKKDGQIDWRMSAKNIYNLIRALTKPYIGAHCIWKNEEVKIWKSQIVKNTSSLARIEPGKVLEVDNQQLRIQCGEDSIRLIEHEFKPLPEKGTYL